MTKATLNSTTSLTRPARVKAVFCGGKGGVAKSTVASLAVSALLDAGGDLPEVVELERTARKLQIALRSHGFEVQHTPELPEDPTAAGAAAAAIAYGTVLDVLAKDVDVVADIAGGASVGLLQFALRAGHAAVVEGGVGLTFVFCAVTPEATSYSEVEAVIPWVREAYPRARMVIVFSRHPVGAPVPVLEGAEDIETVTIAEDPTPVMSQVVGPAFLAPRTAALLPAEKLHGALGLTGAAGMAVRGDYLRWYGESMQKLSRLLGIARKPEAASGPFVMPTMKRPTMRPRITL